MSLPTPMTRLRALRPVPIFRGLTKEDLFEVARMITEVTYPADETVVREGDPGDALYIIVEGTVEIHTGGRVVARMTAGDFFGEISLFDGQPRSATVVAVDDVVLLKLESSDFETLLKIHYIARTALESLAQRFRAAQDSSVP
jgi:CRP-like cAMP-binding protein